MAAGRVLITPGRQRAGGRMLYLTFGIQFVII